MEFGDHRHVFLPALSYRRWLHCSPNSVSGIPICCVYRHPVTPVSFLWRVSLASLHEYCSHCVVCAETGAYMCMVWQMYSEAVFESASCHFPTAERGLPAIDVPPTYPRSQAPPQLFVAYCNQQKAGEEPGSEATPYQCSILSLLPLFLCCYVRSLLPWLL